MLAHLAGVSIRAAVLAVVAGIAIWSLGSRRTAALQHAVWMAVVCGMLALFAFGRVLPRLPLRVLERPAASGLAAPTGPTRYGATAQPARPPATPQLPARNLDWTFIALCAYGAVAFVFFARFATGVVLVRRLVTSSRPGPAGAYESERISVPLTVGWLRPKILLPADWDGWDQGKLNAVLAHEREHIRRRDGLAAMAAGVNRCIFWFHPLSWFIERKLALLAEQACDEACVAVLGNREDYAHLLLEMASVMDLSQGRLRGHAVTMAAALHLRQRIDALMREGRTFSRGLTGPAWAAVAVCAVGAIYGAGAVELDPQSSTPPPPSTSTAKFDSVSIHPCQAGDGAGWTGRGGAGGRGIARSPGRLHVNCLSVREIADSAYAEFGSSPLLNAAQIPLLGGRIKGGPDWVDTERYTIDGQTSDPVANGPTDGRASAAWQLMAGPMLQAVLENQFQLKSHRELETVPMYALTVAKGGLKLQPMQEGECEPDGPPRWLLGEKPPCRWIGWGANGPNRTLVGGGVPLSRVADALGDFFMDRHVLDQTGVSTIFNVRLEFTPDEHTPLKVPDPRMQVDPTSSIPRAGSIFTAIEQQLGLQLTDTKAMQEFFAIDSVQRPRTDR